MSRPHYRSLDGLRALAILPIVWHHSTNGDMSGPLGRGPLGVDLFFVISGFLITSLLLHERASGSLDLGRFWLRRSLRIFPLYYVVLGGFVLHAVLVREHGPVRDYFLRSLPYYATYTSNWFLWKPVPHAIVFSFAWSLATEEQFYVLWPPVLRWTRGLGLPAVVMASLVAIDQGAERGWFGSALEDGRLVVVRSFATPIGLGALLALAQASPVGARVLAFTFRWRAASAIALGALVIAIVEPWPVFPTYLAMTALVGASALGRDQRLAPLFENRIARHLGVVSYALYLLNVPVLWATKRALGAEASSTQVFLIGGPIAILVATVAHHAIERPFLGLRERLRARGDRSPREARQSIAKQ